MPYGRVWNLKNHHLLTFWFMETVSCIVRPCCLFVQVTMIMEKCLRTYYMVISALEKFLRSQKSSAVDCKIVIFYIILNHFRLKSGLEGYEPKKSPIAYVFVNKNCFMRRTIMLFVSTSSP